MPGGVEVPEVRGNDSHLRRRNCERLATRPQVDSGPLLELRGLHCRAQSYVRIDLYYLSLHAEALLSTRDVTDYIGKVFGRKIGRRRGRGMTANEPDGQGRDRSKKERKYCFVGQLALRISIACQPVRSDALLTSTHS